MVALIFLYEAWTSMFDVRDINIDLNYMVHLI